MIKHLFSSRSIFSVEIDSRFPDAVTVEVRRSYWFNLIPVEYELFDVSLETMRGCPPIAKWKDPLCAELNTMLSYNYFHATTYE